MNSLRQQKFIINLYIAKTLLNELNLCKGDCNCGCCDSNCDCGCQSGVNLCSKDCDCGCKTNIEEVELCDSNCDCGCCDGNCDCGCCDSNCDCGCKSNVELCSGDCDCGCKSSVEKTQLCDSNCDCGCCDGNCDCGCCDSNCDCGCQSGVNLCSKDCDCGCKSNVEKTQLCDSNCDCGCKDNTTTSGCECGCGCGCCECESSFNGGDDDGGNDEGKQCQCHCCEENKCECESEKNLANEYLNLARQIQADFDNYRRRNVEAVKQAKIDGIKQAVMNFLPALDAVDRAMEFMKDEQSREGIGLIRKLFEKTFEELNIEPIKCIGAHYDPSYHDVVFAEESSQPSGTIIEEIEVGYTMDGKVIRHSVVKIAK